MIRIPTNRTPTHPGEMLLEEFLMPMGLTQRELADNLSPRIAPRTLQQHLTDYGLPWPIE